MPDLRGDNMIKGQKRRFSQAMLEELFKLRQAGWSLHQLADKYKVDHSSVLYQCQKCQIAKGVPGSIPKIPRPAAESKKFIRIPVVRDEKKIREGRAYSEYLSNYRKSERSAQLAKFDEMVRQAKERMRNNPMI